jgi:hypothetical protein
MWTGKNGCKFYYGTVGSVSSVSNELTDNRWKGEGALCWCESECCGGGLPCEPHSPIVFLHKPAIP